MTDQPPSKTASGASRRPAISWLGHATALIEADGSRLLTDPVVRNRIGPLVRVAAPLARDSLGDVDGVLLSHLHADHADLPSLRELAPVPVFAPRSAGAWLRRKGLKDVRELAPGESAMLGELNVLAIRAAHDPWRRPLGPRADPLGYLVRGSISVYFAGDTDLFDEMAELRGRVDVALLPVSGWGKRLGPGHLSPESAAQAAAIILPRVAIPMHWGTFALGWLARPRTDPDLPALEFKAQTRRCAPGVEVRVLAPGERVEL